ncbi:MAG: thiamine phosphate synthase [Gemmatimonadaceae bacterium]
MSIRPRRSARLTPRLAFDLSLYLVVGPEATAGRDVTSVAQAAVRGGATMVQLRYKTGMSEVMQAAREVIEVLRPAGVPVIINDRVDLARALGAQGVHLGQNDASPAAARRTLGEDAIVGLSITDASQLRAVDPSVVDYLGVGPIFPTGSKPDATAPLGLDVLAEIARSVRLPVAAIGGITEENAADVIRAGADGLAVISAICAADNPEEAARRLVARIDEARSGSR